LKADALRLVNAGRVPAALEEDLMAGVNDLALHPVACPAAPAPTTTPAPVPAPVGHGKPPKGPKHGHGHGHGKGEGD
jgi:hypothetical protein